MAKKEFKYDLTIGMIVKNEIKYLRRCLETLQPLRDALSCQLIITDTGSTDGTREIAKEFADVYLEFEWCDDFAKARNTGVEHAQGRWFFYVDADNTFDESLLEIAHFLKKPQIHTSYDAANIIIRSYTDTAENLSRYYDFPHTALINCSKSKRFFQNAVHESIPINFKEVAQLPTTIHHWGYLLQNKILKKGRNTRILNRMIQEDPKNFKARFQRAKELDHPQEKEAFLTESIHLMAPLAKNCFETQIWLLSMRTVFHHHVVQTKNWDLAQQLIDHWEHYLPDTVIELNFLGFCSLVYLSQGREKQEALFHLFPTYQAAFLKDKVQHDPCYDTLDMFHYAKPDAYYTLETKTIHSAIDAGERDLALLLLSRSDAYSVESQGTHPYLLSYFNFAFAMKAYDILCDLYDFVQIKSPPKEQEDLRNKLTQALSFLPPQQHQEFLSFSKERAIYSQLVPLSSSTSSTSSSLEMVAKLKETLLLLLQEHRLEEGKKLFLSLEKLAPNDPSIPPLKELFFPQ